MLEAARTMGLRQVEVEASADNLTAVRFDRRAGFSEVGRIPDGFRDAGGGVDEVLMVLRLEGAAGAAPGS